VRQAAGVHAGLASQAKGRQRPMPEAAKLIVAVKNIETPDERHPFEHALLHLINLSGVTIAPTVYQPGWKSAPAG
jgi:hypothetical protein